MCTPDKPPSSLRLLVQAIFATFCITITLNAGICVATHFSVMAESCAFATGIQQLMSLIINASYLSKEFFLCGLMSDSSDASEKRSYECTTDRVFARRHTSA